MVESAVMLMERKNYVQYLDMYDTKHRFVAPTIWMALAHMAFDVLLFMNPPLILIVEDVVLVLRRAVTWMTIITIQT